MRRLIPCDAACLLRLEGEELVPLAAVRARARGAGAALRAAASIPRLDIILRARDPVRFPPTARCPIRSTACSQADARRAGATSTPASAARCIEGGEVVGALTADALEPHAFDDLDPRLLATLGALAGAALRTTALIEALETTARAARAGSRASCAHGAPVQRASRSSAPARP